MKAPFKVGDRVIIDAAAAGYRPGKHEGLPATVVRVDRAGSSWFVDVEPDSAIAPCKRCGGPTPALVSLVPECYRLITVPSLFDVEAMS